MPGWVWYLVLACIGTLILLRLFVLSKQVSQASQNYRKAAAAAAADANPHRDGAPLVIYAVKVHAEASGSAVNVIPADPDANTDTALPLVMDDTPAAQVLQSDVGLKNVQHVLLNNKLYRARHPTWARRSDPDLDDRTVGLWLVNPDDTLRFPLGNAGAVSDGLGPWTADAEDGMANCYIVGF